MQNLPQKLYNFLTNAKRQPEQLLTPAMSDFFDMDAGYTLWNMTDKEWKKFLHNNNLMLIEIYPDEKTK